MIRCSSRRRRLLPALLAGLTAVGVLTSCSSAGDAPTEPELGPGVAAVVGDQVVSSDLLAERVRTAAPDLAQALDAQAASQGRPDAPLDSATLADQSRELLTTAVLHEVIAEASRREGIVVPPAEVDAQVVAAGGEQAAAGSGYDLATLRELVSDQIAVAEIGRREFDRLAVTVDIGTFGSRPDAERAAARLATDPGTGVLDALPPQARVVDATLRPGTVQPGEPVSTASSLVFGLPGRTLSISGPSPASPGSTDPDPTMQPWTVVRVRDRSLAAPPPGADTVPASLVDASTMTQFGLRAIQPVSLEMGVRVNPRYGTWDPTQERVAAPPGAAGTVAPLQVAVPFAPPGKVLAPPAPPAPTSPGPTSPGPRSPGPAAPAPAPSPAPAP